MDQLVLLLVTYMQLSQIVTQVCKHAPGDREGCSSGNPLGELRFPIFTNPNEAYLEGIPAHFIRSGF